MGIGSHPAMPFGASSANSGIAAHPIEQLSPCSFHPAFQLLDMIGMLASTRSGTWCARKVPSNLQAIDEFRARPALG